MNRRRDACIIFPGSLSPSPPRCTLEQQGGRGGGRGHRGEIFRWRYPGRPETLLHPVCSRPASHPRGFSHTGISLEDFCPGPSAGSSPERRLSYDPVGPEALRNAPGTNGIPRPSVATRNSASSTGLKSWLDPRSRYSGFVRVVELFRCDARAGSKVTTTKRKGSGVHSNSCSELSPRLSNS